MNHKRFKVSPEGHAHGLFILLAVVFAWTNTQNAFARQATASLETSLLPVTRGVQTNPSGQKHVRTLWTGNRPPSAFVAFGEQKPGARYRVSVSGLADRIATGSVAGPAASVADAVWLGPRLVVRPVRLGGDMSAWDIELPDGFDEGSDMVVAESPDAGSGYVVLRAASTVSPTLPVVGPTSISPSSVNTSDEAKTVRVEASISDPVAPILLVTFWLNHVGSDEALLAFGQLESGTDRDGVWSGDVYVPQYSPTGQWVLEVTVVNDRFESVEVVTSTVLTVTGAGDTAPPTVIGTPTVTPTQIELTGGPVAVTTRAVVTDDVSGTLYVTFAFIKGDDSVDGGFATLIDGTNMSGTWEATAEIPENTPEGTWQLEVTAYDNAMNIADVPTAAMLQVGGGDTQPPTLSGGPTITPQSVDVSQETKIVTVTAEISDNRSGVNYVTFVFDLPDLNSFSDGAQLVSGDASRGTWTAQVEVPRAAEPGTYSLVVEASDVAGNYTEIPTSKQLVVSGGDTEGPRLVGTPSFSPTTADPSGGPVVVHATAVLADDGSGVANATMHLEATDGAPTSVWAEAALVSGNGQEGTWSADMEIGPETAPGTYRLRIYADDEAGNGSELSTTAELLVELALPGLPSDPVPSNGATGVYTWPTLAWTAAPRAASYEVYVWPASGTRPAQPTATSTSTDVRVGPLSSGTEFRWQVVARNGSGHTDGPVWGFTVNTLPDLTVTDVTIPPVALAGQTIEVAWTVTNVGQAATNAANWTDRLHLSTDEVVDAARMDPTLGSFDNVSYLNPGESYRNVRQVTLPRRSFGPYFILIQTDTFDALDEIDEDDNVTSAALQIDLPPAANLRVDVLTVPAEAFSAQTLTVRWKVVNAGDGSVYASRWTDVAYLSKEPVLDPSNVVTTERRRESYQGLEPGATYEDSADLFIPDSLSGPLYVFVVLDVFDDEFEPGGEQDNSVSASVQVTLSPPPDLVPQSVTGPSSGRSGNQIDVEWSVANLGFFTTRDDWYDRVYLSPTPELDLQTAFVLGSAYNPVALAPDSSYSTTRSLKLPDGISGPHWLAVGSDWNRRVFEGPYEDNNVLVSSVPIEIELSPWPDLQVSAVGVSGMLRAGEQVSVSWTVQNAGLEATRGSWTDSLYISTQPTFERSTARPLGALRHATGIAAGSSGRQTTRVMLPSDFAGTGYVHVRADAGQEVYEHTAEGNNDGTSPALSVEPYPAIDLAATEVRAPASILAGSETMVSMTVTNVGGGATLQPFWVNRLYVSTDNVFDAETDLLLDEYFNVQKLVAGESAVKTDPIRIPFDRVGTVYLLLVADATQTARDLNRANNVRSSGPITVVEPPRADLQVLDVSAPATLVAGQPVLLSWTVRNVGPAVTSDTTWTDLVTLSPTLSPRDGMILASHRQSAGLSVGEEYRAEAEPTVPSWLSGAKYLLFHTDPSGSIYESGTLSNNQVAVPVTVTMPPPSDLVVIDVSAPASASVGQEITVSWSLRNQGVNPAVGVSTAGVYLSTDDKWDLADPLVGLDLRRVDLAPGQTGRVSGTFSPWSALAVGEAGEITGRVPGVVPGSYYVLVRADLKNNIPETDELNNTTASPSPVLADLPSLPLGTPVTAAWESRSDVFYRVDPGENVDLRVGFDRSQSFAGGVYVSHGVMPAQSRYDAAGVGLDGSHREVVIPSTLAGPYYVLLHSEDAPSHGQSFTALAEALTFSVTSISPARGGQGPVTVKVHGAGFRPDSRLFLAGPSGDVTEARILSVPSTVELSARFELAGVDLGTYDVIVRNGATGTSLAGGFEVEPTRPPSLEMVRNIPAVMLVNRPTDIVLQFRNSGNTDIPFADIALSIPSTTGVEVTAPDRLMTRSMLNARGGSGGDVADYMDAGGYRMIPLVARNVTVDERMEVKLTLTPVIVPSAEFPLHASWQLQDGATFLDAQLERIEQGRRAVLANHDRADPGWTALAQDRRGFAETVLDGYVDLGLFDEEDVEAALDRMDVAGKADSTRDPGFLTRGSADVLSVANSSACEEFFNWLSCPLAIGDCFIDIPFIPLTAGQSAALCIFGVGTACTGTDVGLLGCIGVLSAINCIAKELICKHLVFSLDPNDIIGPEGYGDRRWVSVRETLAYKVRFENDPDLATAPAQVVSVSLPIDPNLDERTFRNGSFGFGGFTFQVPEGAASYSDRLDLRDSLGIFVDVSAGIDVLARRAFWTMRSIDPATGAAPADPMAGLLAVNDAEGRGEGFVSFTIRPRSTSVTGDSVRAQARIVFDLNAPIDTPPVFNTIDAGLPQSHLTGYTLSDDGSQVELTWTGSDDPNGSGLRDFALYSSKNNEAWKLVRSGLTGSSTTLSRSGDDLYRYFLLASDNTGNLEAAKTSPEITVSTEPTDEAIPTEYSLGQNYPNPFNPTTTIPFSIPRPGEVEMTVYDVLGRRLEWLSLGRLVPGRYEQRFDLGGYASGVYFYELRVREQASLLFRATGKLVLVK